MCILSFSIFSVIWLVARILKKVHENLKYHVLVGILGKNLGQKELALNSSFLGVVFNRPDVARAVL